MTEGINTFKGLAVPLNGGSEIRQLSGSYDILTLSGVSGNSSDYFVLQDSDGTECLSVNYLGRIQHAVTWVAADTMVTAMGTWASFYGAANFKMTSAAASGNVWLSALNAFLTVEDTSTKNIHAATIGLVLGDASYNYGGVTSVLSLIYEEESGATTPTALGNSFIEFYNINTNDPPDNLFRIMNAGAVDTSGCFVTCVAAAADHGLAISVDDTQYYIMLSNTTAA